MVDASFKQQGITEKERYRQIVAEVLSVLSNKDLPCPKKEDLETILSGPADQMNESKDSAYHALPTGPIRGDVPLKKINDHLRVAQFKKYIFDRIPSSLFKKCELTNENPSKRVRYYRFEVMLHKMYPKMDKNKFNLDNLKHLRETFLKFVNSPKRTVTADTFKNNEYAVMF